jgi:hypothetical protein
MTSAEEIARGQERAAIVAWLRSQARKWEDMAIKAEKQFGSDSRTTQATVSIAASYSDHARAIASGEHLKEPRHDQ